jgi:hypothetical protein
MSKCHFSGSRQLAEPPAGVPPYAGSGRGFVRGRNEDSSRSDADRAGLARNGDQSGAGLTVKNARRRRSDSPSPPGRGLG